MAVIKVENLSKRYRISRRQDSYLTLRDALARSYSRLLGKSGQGREDFLALDNINFSVEPGEALGVIGKNGAGKSTLLKVLSRITPPSSGQIIISGRVGSLLEVGTGFHQELTGRENIFFNGAILGMSRQEIVRKFEQIVDFSGIGQFLDTPVKHYSSGMCVRLAFAVAAHLDPDILIIDEVLAVGDIDFQKKSLAKMKEIIADEKRTILFVSHDLKAVEELCSRVLWLENGKIKRMGPAREVINEYAGEEL